MKQVTELMCAHETIEQFELSSDNSAAQIEYDQQQIEYEATYVRCERTDELPF